ncbi:MAG: diguanylate cyclase [Selenomonadaceae bacterium]|nr:diguanylate cyclase [Selenomonadaceae bacterium]
MSEIVHHISGDFSPIMKDTLTDVSLKSLYTLYNRVDLVKADGTEFKNIYSNSVNPFDPFSKGSFKQSIKIFIEKNIHVEDRTKFKKFFDFETLEKRIQENGGNSIIDYFRTKNKHQNFSWKMYGIIPLIFNGEKYYLCCTRKVHAERTKRLPEIDNNGTEYYDMPGNPNFLLLASRSFTSILGYGSFEKFLNNSFYFEVSLTSDKILYMNLGKQGNLSTNLDYMSMSYSEIISDVISNTVVDESQKEIQHFFSIERLRQEYEHGKIFAQTEFLRRSDTNSNPRWLHAAYQIKESSELNEVLAFFLIFDIDAYRRTNDEIISLIERDNLTGLYNRRTAVNMMDKFLAEENKFAFIILDLDNFKQINDRFGHDCGDKIIKDAAERMTKNFSENGIIARLGGDEFLVILSDNTVDEVETRLKNFSLMPKSIEYKNQQVNYTMSIGYSLFPNQGKNYGELYQNADMALYEVKMAGRNGYKKFSPQMIYDNRAQLGVSLSQISEGMPGGFLLYYDNENFEILYANKRLVKIYECESLEQFRKFTGNSFQGCVHPDDWEKVQKTIYEQIEVSAGYDYVRYRIKTAKGNIKTIEDFGRLVHSRLDGDIFYVFIIDFVEKEKLWDLIKS